MSLFHYPKVKHQRQFSPPRFKNYRTYKRYLQTEFARVCVYCRQPDSASPNLNFSVDHYRPKSDPRFKSLLCEYDNLFYCCGACNSRKNDYWPKDHAKDPYIVNPCDHNMASHLRFDSATGKIDHRSADGKFTEELLQLNDPVSVQYRVSTMYIVKALEIQIKCLDEELVEISKALSDGSITKTEYDLNFLDITTDRAGLCDALAQQTGIAAPSPPLTKRMLAMAMKVKSVPATAKKTP